MTVMPRGISIAVLNSAGKVVMECVIETKASTILQFIHGLGGDVHLTFGPHRGGEALAVGAEKELVMYWGPESATVPLRD
jgi:hypothetical protein